MRGLLALVLLLGCGGEEPAQETPPAPAEPEGEEAREETEPEAVQPTGDINEDMSAIVEALQALQEGGAQPTPPRPAAPIPAVEGDTPCERAYNGAVAMVTRMQKQRPGMTDFAPQDVFMGGCEALPEATQRCLEIGYGTEHREECQPLLAAEDAQAFRRSLRSP